LPYATSDDNEKNIRITELSESRGNRHKFPFFNPDSETKGEDLLEPALQLHNLFSTSFWPNILVCLGIIGFVFASFDIFGRRLPHFNVERS